MIKGTHYAMKSGEGTTHALFFSFFDKWMDSSVVPLCVCAWLRGRICMCVYVIT